MIELDIAVGRSADSQKWKNTRMTWDELVKKLSKPVVTNETLKEFLAATRDEQGRIKDVGGFVGGFLSGSRRKAKNVMHRQVIALDLDFAGLGFWDSFTMLYDCAAVCHGTHKHSPEAPRMRLIIPLDREVSAEEYSAISRKIAGTLNIDLFDPTTFEPERLMFWPSCPSDVSYYFEQQEGEPLCADEVLNQYRDWMDSSQWPVASSASAKIRDGIKQQQNPTEKQGIVGIFCRTYSISEAIDNFLSDIYTSAGAGRYTYSKGTTAGGLVVYDDMFAYSHHGTDPCGSNLVNSFDLVRIHLYGHLDRDALHNGSNTASYKEMTRVALENKEIKRQIAAEKLETVANDFADELTGEPADLSWTEKLDIDKSGKYQSTANNLNLILEHDPRLKGSFRQNIFENKKYVVSSTPWRVVDQPEPVLNVDFAGVRNYIECVYNISGVSKIDDALELEFQRRTFHPVREYLSKLRWDGVSRIDTLLPDYLGVEKNVYTVECMRITLAGAVSRVLHPGCKFDTVLTLIGPQGCGKSTFFRKLGKNWFSDTFVGVTGKEAFEQIQGQWIIEMAELSGIRKAEIESVKHFITKQEDTFRQAYARTSERYLRQCIFVATTNNYEFLRDPTGNRRFLPIDVDMDAAIKSIFDISDYDIDQIWAEALELHKKGQKLYLTGEAEAMSFKEQKAHSEMDERTGLIEAYLQVKVPSDWNKRDLHERRAYLTDFKSGSVEEGAVERKEICIAEIWCECLGKSRDEMDRYKTREINDILRSLPGWRMSGSLKNFGPYGRQKFYNKLFAH